MNCFTATIAAGAASNPMNPDSVITPELAHELEMGALGKEVELDQVTRELEAFFGDDEMLTRASLMNFAVFSESPGCLLENHDLIREITRSHACRALLICVAPNQTQTRTRAWVEALCEVNERGGKLICSEQISFLLEGEGAKSMPSLVFSHLRSDLPMVVWWKGELTEYFRERFYSRFDRLIVDSSRWSVPASQFELLAEARNSAGSQFDAVNRGQFMIHDLEYTCGHRFRWAIAQIFDDHRWIGQLTHLSEMEVCYTPPHRNAALYLVAWISTQLKAELVSKSGDEFRFRHGDEELAVHLKTSEESPEEPIQFVRIASQEGEIRIMPSGDHQALHGTVRLGDSELLDEVFPLACLSPDRQVSEILMRGGRNLLLRKVLPRFRELLD